MSDQPLVPENVDELNELLATYKRVLAVGNRTKPPLSQCSDATLVSLSSIRGIIEYEPSEFTFTAYAGTPVAEIAAELKKRRQYLPFDPMLVDAGATLGGTVAAGLSGPGRQRYGGIRDFLLGVQFFSGDGNLITAGGKVVKNAAGFDIPKLMVGSLGRLGAMTQLTFKVFPRPLATHTLLVRCESHQQAAERIAIAASQRWELDAVDYRPKQQTVFLRLAAPPQANAGIAAEIQSRWGRDVVDAVSPQEFWHSIVELTWSPHCRMMVKLPTTSTQFLRLQEALEHEPGFHCHWSVAGNVAWVALDHEAARASFERTLDTLQICGLMVHGDAVPCMIGPWRRSKMETRIKDAMDPMGRFPNLLETSCVK